MQGQRWISVLLVMGLSLSIARTAHSQGPKFTLPSAGFAPGAVPPSGAGPSLLTPDPSGNMFYNPDMPGPPPGPPGGPPPGPPLGPDGWSAIQAGQNGGPGADPDRTAYPNISFFDFDFQQHTNEGGLWFLRQKPWGRDYFFNAEAFIARTRAPDDAVVGNPIIAFNQPPPVPGLAPFAPITTNAFFNTVQTDVNNFPIPLDTILINEQTADPNWPRSYGVKFDWGFREPGGNGLDFGGHYSPEVVYRWQRGLGADVPIGPGGENLRVTAGLPLNDGTAIGTVVPYDRFFRIEFKTESLGTDFAWVYTPIFRLDWLRIQPVVGMRYTYVGEEFGFFGADSGTGVLFNANGTPVVGVVGFPDPFETVINSEVKSHLFGPEVGMQFLVGGKYLRIFSRTTVGAAANFEEIRLSGFGVGDPFTNLNFDPTLGFDETRDHTRLVPTVATEVALEMNLFPLIPGLRRLTALQHAKLRLGYQFLGAWQMQRPHKTIEYNGQPLIPVIREDDRTRWHLDGYTLGIHWDY